MTATITSGAYQIGDAASAMVVVIDNDVRGVTITPTALTIREGSSSSYMVGLDTEPTADVTVAVQVPEGAEISVTPTALTFTAANWNAKQLVVVTAAQDDDTVADDPLTILHAVSGGDYGAVTAASVVVTILEDDPAIRIADAAAVEGAGEMAFSVRLSVPSIQTVTVDWTTADGTAIAGQDYAAATGTLTFSALATTQTIRVPIIDDDLDETAETFTVALSNSNAEIADGEAIGVIADDDLPVVNLTTDLAGVVEGETVAFTLTRSRRPDRAAEGASTSNRARLVSRRRSTHRSDIRGACSDDHAAGGDRRRRARRGGRCSDDNDHQRPDSPGRRCGQRDGASYRQ